ncbi:MAG: ABC transporter permease, partial [Deltaproteobacteria bacterium]|nr:ABC transporter permease [Kofleriaceae bacterium]
MSAFLRLFNRELLRVARRPSQLVSTLAMPIMMWIFLGAGFAGTMQDGSFTAHLAPGMAILVVMFATIFVGMSLIEDRHMGFLQGVLVSPAPRWAVAGSKLASAAVLGAVQGVPLLLMAPLLGEGSGLGVLLASVVLLLTAVAIGGFGLALAWWIDSSRGYHGVMMILIFPLWLLSGAVFTDDTAAGWIVAVSRVNPIGWCRTTADAAMNGTLGSVPLASLGCILFALAGALAATRT